MTLFWSVSIVPSFRCRSLVVAEDSFVVAEIPSSSMKIPSKSMKIPSKSMKIPSKSMKIPSKFRRNRRRRQPKSFVAESQFVVVFSPKSSSPSSPSLRSLLRRRLPLRSVMSSSSFSSSSPNKLPPSLPLHLNHHHRHCHHHFLHEMMNIITSLHLPLSSICLKYHNLHVFVTCFQIISVCQLIFRLFLKYVIWEKKMNK